MFLAAYGFIYSEHNRGASEEQSSTLTLSGNIEADLRYKVVVEYIATKDSFWCKKHAMVPFTYTRPSTRMFEYLPIIDNGKHSITLALSEYSSNKGCRYRPIKVDYVLAPRSQKLLKKNRLITDSQNMVSHLSEEDEILDNIDSYSIGNPKVLNKVCYPFIQSALQENDPNKNWTCYPSDVKKYIRLKSDFKPSINPKIILNIKTGTYEQYKRSCFSWVSSAIEKCRKSRVLDS